MSIVHNKTVVGIFDEQNRAREAIQELGEAGYSRDQVEIMFRTGVPIVNRVDAEETSGDLVQNVLDSAQALLAPILGHATTNADTPIAGQKNMDPPYL
jgi:hypothetical protein